jgi:lactate racemase
MSLLHIPYVDRSLPVEIPERNLIFDVEPLAAPPAADFAGTLRRALAQPVGTPVLTDMVRTGQKIVIVADDNTRITPVSEIIPVLLDTLNACGIPDADVKVVIASGTHRLMTDAEIDEKYGAAVLSRIPVLRHYYKEPSELVNYGTTPRGTRIFVNRHVVEADFRIAVGNVIPHHPTGWSAGAKAVLPGVAGEETVAQMHYLGSKNPGLGTLDTEMRREMEDFAHAIHLDFVLQVILNRDGELVDAVSGHFIAAHRAAIDISKQVYGLPIPEAADITISSTAPVDYDFFQGDKGITSAEPATRIGGEIILVSGCLEGVSPSHPELADYVGKLDNPEIWRLFHTGSMPDPLTGAEAIMLNDIKAKVNITLVTEGLSPELCASLGFRHVLPDHLNAYVAERLAQTPDAKIGILRQSAEVLPIITGKQQ